MPASRIEDVVDARIQRRAGSKLWAEWCFLRVCARRFAGRLLLLAVILLGGGMLFKIYEPDQRHSLPEAMYYAFSLVFGEPPEAFPEQVVLQIMFFLVPILGLAVIIEGIIDFSLVLRDRRRFERSWCAMLAASFSDHVIIMGLGKLGYRTYLLLRRLGQAVAVIERNPNNRFLEEVRRDGAPVIIGDARDERLLADLNVAAAKSIVLATDDDMANLETAMDARRLNPNISVVLRMFDQNTADKIQDGFNIDISMSQSAISAPTFATCAVAPTTHNSFILGDRLITMQRWLVRQDGPLNGKSVAQVMRQFGVSVLEHMRNGGPATFCPDPDLVLKDGDDLMLQGPTANLDNLRDADAAGKGD